MASRTGTTRADFESRKETDVPHTTSLPPQLLIMSSYDKVVKLACKPKAAPPKPKVRSLSSLVVIGN